MLTHDRVRELFDYDPETGLLSRRVHAGSRGRGRAGSPVGHKNSDGYLMVGIEGSVYSVHRLVWFWLYGEWPSQEIDHINRVRHDNRVDNLRDVSKSQNAVNAPAPFNATGCKGVRRDKGKFRADIRVNGKKVYLGSFDTVEEAQQVFKSIHAKLHGEVSEYFFDLHSGAKTLEALNAINKFRDTH